MEKLLDLEKSYRNQKWIVEFLCKMRPVSKANVSLEFVEACVCVCMRVCSVCTDTHMSVYVKQAAKYGISKHGNGLPRDKT